MISHIDLVLQSVEAERIKKFFTDLNKLGFAGAQNAYNKLVMLGKIRI
jgi:hypothetical protein